VVGVVEVVYVSTFLPVDLVNGPVRLYPAHAFVGLIHLVSELVLKSRESGLYIVPTFWVTALFPAKLGHSQCNEFEETSAD
jgi:hypothetical protein